VAHGDIDYPQQTDPLPCQTSSEFGVIFNFGTTNLLKRELMEEGRIKKK